MQRVQIDVADTEEVWAWMHVHEVICCNVSNFNKTPVTGCLPYIKKTWAKLYLTARKQKVQKKDYF